MDPMFCRVSPLLKLTKGPLQVNSVLRVILNMAHWSSTQAGYTTKEINRLLLKCCICFSVVWRSRWDHCSTRSTDGCLRQRHNQLQMLQGVQRWEGRGEREDRERDNARKTTVPQQVSRFLLYRCLLVIKLLSYKIEDEVVWCRLVFHHLPSLVKWFKEHFRDVIPGQLALLSRFKP